MKINIIGDIAGRFDELMLLLAKMPEADLVLSVGDLVDRGPKSKEVLDWFMSTPNTEALYGNHEELMWQSCMYGDSHPATLHMWMINGGDVTKAQFEQELGYVPSPYLDWLASRPLYFKQDGLFVSHAPVQGRKHVPKDPYARTHEATGFFIWNRTPPAMPWKDTFQIYGHNGTFFEQVCTKTGEPYAWCIDNSDHDVLTGVHWPTREVFEQKYLENL